MTVPLARVYAGNCETVNVADGTACDGDTGTCNAGVCEPAGPDCLRVRPGLRGMVQGTRPSRADLARPTMDGWYGGNVYDSGGVSVRLLRVLAPTRRRQILGHRVGEGGPEQGAQQLVVFSNYDTTSRSTVFGTDRSRALVFRRSHDRPGDYRTDLHLHVRREARQHRGCVDGVSVHQDDRSQAQFRDDQQHHARHDHPADSWGTYSISSTWRSMPARSATSCSTATDQGVATSRAGQLLRQRHRRSGRLAVAAEVLALVVSSTVNGDFEAGNISGWSVLPANDGTFNATQAQSNGGAGRVIWLPVFLLVVVPPHSRS